MYTVYMCIYIYIFMYDHVCVCMWDFIGPSATCFFVNFMHPTHGFPGK